MKNMLLMAIILGSLNTVMAHADEMAIIKFQSGEKVAQISKEKMVQGVGPAAEIFSIASKCGLSSTRGSYGTMFTGKRIHAYRGSNDLNSNYERGEIRFELKNIHEAHVSDDGKEMILIGMPATELMECMMTANFTDRLNGEGLEYKSKHIDCKKMDAVGFATCTISQ